MALFDNIKNVKASLDANYVQPGHYAFLIEAGKVSKDRTGIPFVVLEMVCVGVFDDSPSFMPPAEDKTLSVRQHFQGERASHLIKNGGPGADMFLPNVKAMLAGISSRPEESITTEDANAAFVVDGQTSVLRGLVVEVSARNQKSQKTGKNFTKITYRGCIDPEKFPELGIRLPEAWQG